jgi:hypothetical protein
MACGAAIEMAPPLGDYQTEAAALPGAPDHHWNLLQSMLNP